MENSELYVANFFVTTSFDQSLNLDAVLILLPTKAKRTAGTIGNYATKTSPQETLEKSLNAKELHAAMKCRI